MADPRILLNNIDIYALGYCSEIINVNEKKTFQKDKLITNTHNLNVENYDNFFSVNNPVSMFSGIKWLYFPVEIYNKDEELIWDGYLTGIDRNHNTKTAILKTKSKFFKYRDITIDYTSSDWETPSAAFKNICDDIGFTDYNEASVNTSNSIYIDNNCYIKCDIETEDNITFQAIAEKLGDYGNADVYGHLGELYFVHWKPYSGGVAVSLNTNDRDKFRSLPQVTEVELDILNDYKIGYYGDNDTPATDVNNNNIGNVSRLNLGTHSLPETSSGEDEQIVYKDLTSAVYIGESYIRRTQKDLSTNPQPLTKISFNLFSDNKEWITLQSYFKLTFPDEGWEGWTEKIFEVFEFTIDEDNDNLEVIGYEVVT